MSNENEISKLEHDFDLQMKKGALYGWDGSNAVMLKTNSSGEVILDSTNLDSRYVEVAGDTMTGALTLSGAPTLDLHAATKKYVDDNSGSTAWGGITGTLSSQTDLQTELDAKLDLAGGTMTGDIIIGDSTSGIKTGDYTGYLESGVTGTGTAPSQVDGNIVSYWAFDDDAIQNEDTTDTSLIAWWKMDEGSGTTLADSANTNTGTINGATWFGSSPFTSGDALTFDGSNDDVTLSSLSTSISGDFTYYVWVRFGESGSAQRFIDLAQSGSGGAACFTSSGQIYLDNSGGPGGSGIASGGSLNDDNWHMVVITRSGTTYEMYVDGVSKGTTTGTAPTYTRVFLGQNAANTTHWAGELTGFALYNDVRSADEVLRDYDAGLATVAIDSTGTNHGTITNATFNTSGYFGYTGDDSLDFNGTSAVVSVPDNSDLSFGNGSTDSAFTIYAWAKADTYGALNPIIGKYSSGTTREYELYYESGVLKFLCYDESLNGFIGRSYSTVVSDTDWHFYAVTYSGSGASSGVKIYKDGVQVDNANNASGSYIAMENLGGTFDIGRLNNGTSTYYFDGSIDNCVVFNDVRSAAEILADYNSGLPAGDAWIHNTANTIGATGTLAKWQNNGVTKAYVTSAGGLNLADDLIVDTDLLFVDVSAQTVNINNSTAVDSILDEDNMATNSAMALATQQSIKAYVDAQVGTVDTLAEILAYAEGSNTTGGTNLIVSAGDQITVDTINETTAATGVTIDGVVLKDTTVDVNGTADAIILDADGDTTISAPTDDQIDFEIAGADDFRMTANSFTALSGSTIYTDTIGETTAAAGITFNDQIILADQSDAIKTGNYTGCFQSGVTGVGTPPSTSDGGVVAYYKLDDNGTFPQDTSDANLVAWWKFEDGSGSTLTDSAGSNDGTIANGTWVGSGAFNKSTDSIDFNGSSTKVTVPNDSVFDFGDGSTDSPFTLSAWINVDDFTTFRIITKGAGSSSNSQYVFSPDGSDKMRLSLFDASTGGRIDMISNSAYTSDAGSWHQWTATYDGTGSGGLKLYRDGVAIAATESTSGSYTAMEDLSQDFLIGVSGTSYANGKIDNVCVYSDVRTADEILRDYNTTKTTITVDSVGTNHGTITGATFTSPGYFGYTGDEALDFTGVGASSYVGCGNPSALDGASAFTIYFWVRMTSTLLQAGGFLQYYNDNNNRIYIAPWTDGLLYVKVNNGGEQFGTVNMTTAGMVADEWAMIAMVYDGSESGNANRLKAFVNGVQQTLSFSGTIQSTGPSSGTFEIGRGTYSGSQYSQNADMDNVVVYSDARTAAEVLADYNAGIASGDAWVNNTSNTLGSSGTLGKWQNNGTTKAYIKADGNLYNASDEVAAYSDGTTGGTGSAGAGNQYIEININGTTYKVLHDGTV